MDDFKNCMLDHGRVHGTREDTRRPRVTSECCHSSRRGGYYLVIYLRSSHTYFPFADLLTPLNSSQPAIQRNATGSKRQPNLTITPSTCRTARHSLSMYCSGTKKWPSISKPVGKDNAKRHQQQIPPFQTYSKAFRGQLLLLVALL
jgi:hypothetical protein